jgi:molybdate transport system substrate-binding protein
VDRRRFLADSLNVVAALALLPACGGDERTITVAAAADLRDALGALKPRLESVAGASLRLVFGSSGQLKSQILGGARYHLFLSADAGYVRELEQAGRTLTTTAYAVGRLALAWRDRLPPLTAIVDLVRPDVKRIAIAQPSHAPYGRAAQQAVTGAGLWEQVKDRIVYAENIRQATDYVEGGNADAGLVALALVIKSGSPYLTIPALLHDAIVQTGAVIKGTSVESGARSILAFLSGPEGQEALAEYGFERVPAV